MIDSVQRENRCPKRVSFTRILGSLDYNPKVVCYHFLALSEAIEYMIEKISDGFEIVDANNGRRLSNSVLDDRSVLSEAVKAIFDYNHWPEEELASWIGVSVAVNFHESLGSFLSRNGSFGCIHYDCFVLLKPPGAVDSLL
jgi:hypothetical protein